MLDREKTAQAVFDIASRYSDLAFQDRNPVRAIQSGDPDDIVGKCGSLSKPEVARELGNSLGKRVRTVWSDHPDRINTHLFMEDEETNVIVDPTFTQFVDMPKLTRQRFNGTLNGNMFIGTREELRQIINDPEVSIMRCSTADDKDLSTRRIWGEKGKPCFVIDLEKFYGY